MDIWDKDKIWDLVVYIEYKLIAPAEKCISDQIGSDIQRLVYSSIRSRSVIHRVRSTIWGQMIINNVDNMRQTGRVV